MKEAEQDKPTWESLTQSLNPHHQISLVCYQGHNRVCVTLEAIARLQMQHVHQCRKFVICGSATLQTRLSLSLPFYLSLSIYIDIDETAVTQQISESSSRKNE